MTNYSGSAQQKADKKYRQKIASSPTLREIRNLQAQYRSAKSYITKRADRQVLEEFATIISDRKKKLDETK